MTRELTITEGMQEMKLLSSKIDKLISNTTFIELYRSNSNMVPDLLCKDASEKFQSLQDLIDRRSRIKSAIMQSNAVTKVTIADKIYTVAEALAAKSSILDKKRLLERLYEGRTRVHNDLITYNAERQRKIDSLIEKSFGRDNNGKQHAEDIQSITDIYIKKNYASVVDPIQIDKVIASLEEEIEQFENAVDHKLSYINAITIIKI